MENKFKVGDRVRKLATASAGKVLAIGVNTKYRTVYKVEFPYCTDWFLEDELEKADEVINGS